MGEGRGAGEQEGHVSFGAAGSDTAGGWQELGWRAAIVRPEVQGWGLAGVGELGGGGVEVLRSQTLNLQLLRGMGAKACLSSHPRGGGRSAIPMVAPRVE